MNLPQNNTLADSSDVDTSMFVDYPDLLSVSDVQNALSIGRSMAYRLINDGKIKHLRVGRAVKIPKRFLIDYVVHSCYNSGAVTGNPSCPD